MDAIRWCSTENWQVYGKGWNATDGSFTRLPAHAKELVPADVWTLGKHSTGLYLQFESDAQEFFVRYHLAFSEISMPHMPATSVSGVDLYAKDESGGWRWVAVSQPEGGKFVECRLNYGLAKGKKLFRLYLPLFNGVETLNIGIREGYFINPYSYGTEKPIVFYGTSIVHGIAASRPGMCHTSILGRKLGEHIVNLGFSGRGKMEAVLANLISEIDARIYIIDCLPNMMPDLVKERAEKFISNLIAKRPDRPIVLVEDRTYANSWIVPELKQRNLKSREVLRKVYEEMVSVGGKNLIYLEGNCLLGEDDEATVDGTHPSDLGFLRMADQFEKILLPILQKKDE